jgi:hypothetical protein
MRSLRDRSPRSLSGRGKNDFAHVSRLMDVAELEPVTWR